MKNRNGWFLLTLVILSMRGQQATADETVTLDNFTNPGPSRAEEPLAPEFSIDNAVRFMDSASLHWQKKKGCLSCHTNFAYLYARPAISAKAPAHTIVRQFAEELVRERWPEKGPRSKAEVVAAAAALAFNDAATSGELHDLTRTALDRMWTIQQENGGWDWPNCGWPPMESDDHYGVTLAAIAVGVAPGEYARTESAQKGLAGIRKYLKNNPPSTLHQEAMILWAGSYLDALVTQQERESVIKKLWKLQKEDGGWGLATLGEWKRSDGGPQDRASSDGYGTGFVVYVLRRAGVPATANPLKRGIDWLKTNQRVSGRWYTRSLNKDNRHYITHAGTAMVLLALSECKQIDEPSVN